MTSPDTIILLIVDYHAATGGKTPVPPPLVYAPAKVTLRAYCVSVFYIKTATEFFL